MKISTITKYEMESLLELAPEVSGDDNDVMFFTSDFPEEAEESDCVSVDDPEACSVFFQVRLMRDSFSRSYLVAIHSFFNIIKNMQERGINTDGFSIKYEKGDETFVINKEYALIKKHFNRYKD